MPKWMLLSFLTLVFWGLWAALPRGLSVELSAFHQQTLSTVGLLPILVFMAFSWRRHWRGLRWQGVVISFVAGLFGAGGNVAYYEALNASTAASAVVTLTALYPVVTVILAALLLRERPNLPQLVGIILALAAIYVFNPLGSQADLSTVSSYAFLPIGFYGIAGLLQKFSTRTLSGEQACFWFLAAFVPVAVWCILRDSTLSWGHAPRDWMVLVGVGLTYGLGNWTLLAAFARGGKATVVTPLTGLYYVMALPILVLAFGETIGQREWWGIGLSVAAVVGMAMERAPTRTTAATVGT